jgi:hypothetical protein
MEKGVDTLGMPNIICAHKLCAAIAAPGAKIRETIREARCTRTVAQNADVNKQ